MYNDSEHRIFGLANLDVLNSFFDEGERAAVVAALSFCGELLIKIRKQTVEKVYICILEKSLFIINDKKGKIFL